jgi:hypothetical protein
MVQDRPVGEGINLNRPGSFTEEFKRVMAAREASVPQTEQPGERISAAPTAVEVPAVDAAPAPLAEEAAPGVELPRLELPELRAALIRTLSQDRGILASGLEKSLPWEWAGEQLLIPVQDPLTAELLKKERPFIRQSLENLWRKPLAFEIIERNDGAADSPDSPKEPELSPQVEMVLRMFRGTVVTTSNNGEKK